jgi:ATP-dependent Clp protease ATP-binding subunit ClpC
VRRKPYSVVLLDEIEKAHPDVFNILLQILEDGRLTDSQGRTVDFRNVIVIMTSNIGADLISKNTPLGFAQTDTTGLSYESMKSKVTGELKRLFRPEFLNRVDEVIVFHKLAREEIRQIVDLMVIRVNKQLVDRGVTIEMTEAGRDLLVEQGYDPVFGARPLRRAIQRYIEDKLADAMLANQFRPGAIVMVDRDGDDSLLTVNGERLEQPVDVDVPIIDETLTERAGAPQDGEAAAETALAAVPGETA